jgi:hypothetical protein
MMEGTSEWLVQSLFVPGSGLCLFVLVQSHNTWTASYSSTINISFRKYILTNAMFLTLHLQTMKGNSPNNVHVTRVLTKAIRISH